MVSLDELDSTQVLSWNVTEVKCYDMAFFDRGAGGGGMFGDVNISAILDSLSVSYDKRVRPNYGG